MHIRVPILDFQFGQDFNYGKYLDHWALCVVWTWIPCLQFPLLYKQSTYFFDLGCMYFLYISKIAKSYSKNYKRYEKTLSYSPSFKSSTKSLDKMVNKRSFLKISVPEVMVFCFQNCSDLLWEKIVLMIEKHFWNSGLKAENL